MTTATTGLTVSIDPALDRQSDLHAAIMQVMDYLYARPGMRNGDMTASWKLATPSGNLIEFELSERDGSASLSSRRNIPREHLLTPTLRDLWALRVLGGLTDVRSDRNQKRIRELVTELIEESNDGGAADGPVSGHRDRKGTGEPTE